MGVRMKLGLSYLAMVLMIVFLGIYALVSMANMQAATNSVEISGLKYIKQADDLNVAVSDYKAAMYKMLAADDENKKNIARRPQLPLIRFYQSWLTVFSTQKKCRKPRLIGPKPKITVTKLPIFSGPRALRLPMII